jgi:hypothetical protein
MLLLKPWISLRLQFVMLKIHRLGIFLVVVFNSDPFHKLKDVDYDVIWKRIRKRAFFT